MNTQKEIQVFATAAKMLKAVAHPVRIEIIKHLIKRKRLTVNDLKEKLRITQSMTSQHLAVLRNAGILDCEKQANTCCYFIRNKNVLKLLDCVEHCAKAC
jgi:ArsR family transcriptional regulator